MASSDSAASVVSTVFSCKNCVGKPCHLFTYCIKLTSPLSRVKTSFTLSPSTDLCETSEATQPSVASGCHALVPTSYVCDMAAAACVYERRGGGGQSVVEVWDNEQSGGGPRSPARLSFPEALPVSSRREAKKWTRRQRRNANGAATLCVCISTRTRSSSLRGSAQGDQEVKCLVRECRALCSKGLLELVCH